MKKLLSKISLLIFLLLILMSQPIFANNNINEFTIKINNYTFDLNRYIAYKNNEFKTLNPSAKSINKNKFYISYSGIKIYLEFKNDEKPFAILSVSNAKCDVKNDQLNISKTSSSSANYFLLDINLLNNKISITSIKKIITDNNSNYTFLVNRSNPLSSKYVPKSLINLKGKVNAVVSNSMKLEKTATLQLNSMISAANKNGISGFIIRSAFRSYIEQSNLYNSYLNKFKKLYPSDYKTVTSKYVQTPGMSEHQTGLALDISSSSRDDYPSFEQTAHYKWLKQNSWKYGFIIRYPKDKTKITGITFEPWHFRYVGNPVAELIYRNNWTLEEYKNYINKNSFILFKSYKGKYYIITNKGFNLINR